MIDWDQVEKNIKVTAIIRKDGSKDKPYCVYSEDGKRNFGCYKTREGAERRLKQLEMFKHMKEDKNA